MYPLQPADENVGGGKRSKISKPQEQMVITIDQDRQIHALERQQQVIDDCLDDAGELTRTVITELYFRKHPAYTMTGLSEKLNYNKIGLYELRNKFIEKIATKLGIFEP